VFCSYLSGSSEFSLLGGVLHESFQPAYLSAASRAHMPDGVSFTGQSQGAQQLVRREVSTQVLMSE
jgi:hypothetical protein